jgi:hypothetical protein
MAPRIIYCHYRSSSTTEVFGVVYTTAEIGNEGEDAMGDIEGEIFIGCYVPRHASVAVCDADSSMYSRYHGIERLFGED